MSIATEFFSSLISCFLHFTLDFHMYFKLYLKQCEIQVLLYINTSIILGQNMMYINYIFVTVAMYDFIMHTE